MYFAYIYNRFKYCRITHIIESILKNYILKLKNRSKEFTSTETNTTQTGIFKFYHDVDTAIKNVKVLAMKQIAS